MRSLSLVCGIFFSLFTFSARGQFFVDNKGACPGAGDDKNKVKFDTLFYAPDRQMPFDKCFVMVVPYDKPDHVVGFAISPVDKNGKPNPRRRDYHAYIKSGYHTRKSRRQQRKEYDFNAFANAPFVRIFTSVKVGGDEAHPTLILQVSPLDPDREYRIFLLLKDVHSIKELVASGGLLFNSFKHDRIALRDSVAISLYDSSRKSYSVYEDQRKPSARDFDVATFETFAGFNGPLALKYSGEELEKYKRGYPKHKFTIRQYQHFYFVDSLTSPQPADSSKITKSRPFTIIDRNEKQQVSLLTLIREAAKGQLEDIDGNTVSVKDKHYIIYRMTEDSVFSRRRKGRFYDHRYGRLTQLGNVVFGDSVHANIAIKSWKAAPDLTLNSVMSGLYARREDNKDTIAKVLQEVQCRMNQPALRLLINTALNCDCEEDTRKNIIAKNDTIRVLAILHDDDPVIFNRIRQGVLSLKDVNKEADENDLAGRMANLETSINLLNNVREYIWKVRAIDNVHQMELTALLKCVDSEKAQFKLVSQSLKLMSDAGGKIETAYYDEFDIKKTVPINTSSSEILELVSAAKFRIVPDFGLVGVLKGENGFGFQDMVPYLGFNINFRSIDKNIPMHMVRYKTWRHYFSFVAGITLRSVAIAGKREDFFGNSSFLTGLGLRLSNYIKLTGGTVWFKGIDPNPLSANKPVRVSPYAGISIDLELRELFGGVAKIFSL